MGRDLRGRASFTRSTVTDTVARLSRPLDRLAILQSTCALVPCQLPRLRRDARYQTGRPVGNHTSRNGNCTGRDTGGGKERNLVFSRPVRVNALAAAGRVSVGPQPGLGRASAGPRSVERRTVTTRLVPRVKSRIGRPFHRGSFDQLSPNSRDSLLAQRILSRDPLRAIRKSDYNGEEPVAEIILSATDGVVAIPEIAS